MTQSGSKKQKTPGSVAAVFAGLPLGAAVVTAIDVTGNGRLAMAGAALVSLLVVYGGIRMEASQNRESSGFGMAAQKKRKYSVLTLFLVAALITFGAGVTFYLGIAWPPPAVVLLTAVAVLGIAVAAIFAAIGRRKAKKARSSFNSWQ